MQSVNGMLTIVSQGAMIIALAAMVIALVAHWVHHLNAVERERSACERLALALDAAQLAFWDWDVPSGTLQQDARIYGMLGYTDSHTPEETAAWWQSQMHPDDVTRGRDVLLSSDHAGDVHEFEYRIQRRDGTWCWISDRARVVARDADGWPRRIVGALRDVTHRHQAEEDIRIHLAAIEQAAEGILICDAKGKILYVNPAFESVTGYTREEVLGATPSMLKSGRHTAEFYAEMWKVLNAGHVWRGRIINRRKDGSFFEEESAISPIRDRHGRVTHYVAVKRDVSHESELESQLRQAQKMEALGTLAGGIAHDFNNILSPILGYTELMLEDTTPDSPIFRYLEEVYKGARRASDLVAQILTFSRRREHEQRPMLMHPILKEALKLLQGSLPATIEIRSRIDESCAPVLADSTQIHQLIMNLCTNAYHAMREHGGVLEVELKEVTLDHKRVMRDLELEPGDYVSLTVRDSGCGMSADLMDRIFDPYFTTKKPKEGTGLGLATVHGIVESCGGAISVESILDEGTSFTVYLPTCIPDEALEEVSESAKPVPRGDGQLIMVVDDEEAISQFEEILLRHLGYNVEAFVSSVQALRAFESAPERYAAVLTDQTMPNLTGEHLARRMLEIRSDIPIVLCTGFSESLTEEKALEMGILAYLRKPMATRQVAECMRAALQGKHYVSESQPQEVPSGIA